MKYLVKISPLEPYSFGGDQNFKYKDEVPTGKESYFLRSKEVPEQTTILGTLRYLILQEKGLLKTSFTYDVEERNKMKGYIGGESFSYLKTKAQNFGSLKSISPVFLMNQGGDILVKNPFHNTAENGYQAMKMGASVETSYGNISLPLVGEYDAKNGHAYGFINLSNKKVETGLFDTKLVVGNQKNGTEESKKDGFFKREMKTLKEGYCFAVYVETEEDVLPQKTVAYMGKKKSAFLIETEKERPDDLSEKVQACFCEGDIWYYALSDIVVQQPLNYGQFCIVEEKYQRNLETIHGENGHAKRVKSEIRHHLIESGSVFYQTEPVIAENENAKQIGYNRVVKIGGK